MARKFKLILIIIFINFSSCAKKTPPPQIPEDILKAALNLPQSSSEATLATNVSPILAPNIPTPSNLAANNENQPNESVNQETKNVEKNPCLETSVYYDSILSEIVKGNENVLLELPSCFILDRALILKAVIIDPNQFQYANEILQEDELFVKRLLKISPEILQFATPEIRGSEIFMEQASYINRNAIKYASWKLLDNKVFMKKMIEIDSHNYQFASDRIKNIKEYAKIAFEDNGMLLEFAPKEIRKNKKIAKIALESNNSAFQFLPEELKKESEFKELSKHQTSITNPEELINFIKENYINQPESKNLTAKIVNKAKFFKKRQLISRNYITKWQDYINYSKREGIHFAKDTRLITADNRNYHISWRQDFKEYPQLIKKIEKFLTKRNLAENILDNLSTTYFWKIQDKPLTIAFNLYLMRESSDEALGPDFVDVTSMNAILRQKSKNDWQMTIIEVVLDNEIETSPNFENGHKKYILWDLYQNNKNDKNPKLIFKVEDNLENYFEVFEAQANHKYKRILSIKNNLNL